MMLSRVAERLYWMARYLERAEDTARLVNAFSLFVLDIPKGMEPGWDVLVRTIDAQTVFASKYSNATERNTIRFLLADDANPSSLRHSVRMARENVRTTRDVLPRFAWELMNELHLLVDKRATKSVARGARREFLDVIIGMNQQFNGLLDTTVTRDHTLWFIRLGQFVERCDMSSRIVDVAAHSFSERAGGPIPGAPLLGANLLQSLSATAAFRRSTGPIIVPDEVIDFVFKSPTFPRSLTHCINAIEETTSQLKAPGGMLRQIRSMARKIQRIDTTAPGRSHLHARIDEFQADLGDLHEAISEHWFLSA